MSATTQAEGEGAVYGQDEDGEILWAVEKVLEERTCECGPNKTYKEYKVKWENCEEPSWCHENQFPLGIQEINVETQEITRHVVAPVEKKKKKKPTKHKKQSLLPPARPKNEDEKKKSAPPRTRKKKESVKHARKKRWEKAKKQHSVQQQQQQQQKQEEGHDDDDDDVFGVKDEDEQPVPEPEPEVQIIDHRCDEEGKDWYRFKWVGYSQGEKWYLENNLPRDMQQLAQEFKRDKAAREEEWLESKKMATTKKRDDDVPPAAVAAAAAAPQNNNNVAVVSPERNQQEFSSNDNNNHNEELLQSLMEMTRCSNCGENFSSRIRSTQCPIKSQSCEHTICMTCVFAVITEVKKPAATTKRRGNSNSSSSLSCSGTWGPCPLCQNQNAFAVGPYHNQTIMEMVARVELCHTNRQRRRKRPQQK